MENEPECMLQTRTTASIGRFDWIDSKVAASGSLSAGPMAIARKLWWSRRFAAALFGVSLLLRLTGSGSLCLHPCRQSRVRVVGPSSRRFSKSIAPSFHFLTELNDRTSTTITSQPTSDSHANPDRPNLRGRLRQLTGFSWTALRATARAATGVSLTAIYATSLAASGAWVRQTMSLILGIFPTWFRYFLQPFLVLYYAPLFVLRNLTGPTRSNAKRKHKVFVEGWKHAVEIADETTIGWPLHVRNGVFVKDFPEVDLNEAVAEAVDISLEEKSKLWDESS